MAACGVLLFSLAISPDLAVVLAPRQGGGVRDHCKFSFSSCIIMIISDDLPISGTHRHPPHMFV